MTKAEELARFNELTTTYGVRGLAALVISHEKYLDRRPAPRPYARKLLERAAKALASDKTHKPNMKLAGDIQAYLEACAPQGGT